MFTGIITEIGTVAEVRAQGRGIRIVISAPESGKELRVNDSVSVSGVCQTVIRSDGASFEVEAVEETLKKTTLGSLKKGSAVNLELPVRLNDRLGGHLVQGHVDCVGTVRGVVKQSNSWLITIAFPEPFARSIVPVGSIAVDGISLTVASLGTDEFTVSIIPHTLEMTTIASVREGSLVNLEFDVIGKYVGRLLEGEKRESRIDEEKLRRWGYDV